MDVTALFQVQQISLVKVTLQHSSLKFVLVKIKTCHTKYIFTTYTYNLVCILLL